MSTDISIVKAGLLAALDRLQYYATKERQENVMRNALAIDANDKALAKIAVALKALDGT
jgi:hypothetical protein